MATSGHESEVINVGGLKAALQDLNNGQQKCISLASIPTDTTLTYSVTDPVTSQAVTKHFKVGDRVVVEDREHGDEEYDYLVVYTLLKLYKEGNTDKALWAPGGAGGSGAVTGKVKVSIAAYVNDIAASAALLGNVTVTLTNTTDGGTPQTATWNGTDVTFSKLTPLKDYRVSIEDKTGWLRNKAYEDVASLGISEEKSVSFTFSADEYTCFVSGTADGRIVVGGTEYANGQTFRVAKGTSISATAKAVANYVTPTPSISGKTISATYIAYGVLTVVTTSNQDEQGAPDATIAAVTPTVKVGDASAVAYSAPMPIAPNASVEVEWPSVAGYTAPSKQTFTMPSTDTTKSGEYATEILTVTVNQEDGDDADISGATVTVTDQTASAAVTAGQDGKYKIPGGHTYLVTVSDVQGYNTPTHTAETACDGGRKTNAVTMTYVYNPIDFGYIILDQTQTDPTKKVVDEEGHTYSNYTRPAVIDAIRAASHCYVGTYGSGRMMLRQLDDSDGTLYADGTSAATDIATEGKDVWMRLPEFYTRVSTVATDKVKVEFAYGGDPGEGWKKWGGDLIGKYKGYDASSKLYSVSGKASTASISQADFKSHAQARGTGYSLVKWKHQNIMAILFYAYYGHTNCQTICGTGANSRNRVTGQKNSLGMADTTSSNGNTDNIVFWGLENWWGDLYEWVDNVVIDNHTWTITEDDGSTRTVPSSSMASVNDSTIYPSKFILGDNLDVIAAAGQTGGSDSAGYCDGQYYTSSGSRVVARSYSYASTVGGVACVNAYYDSSVTHAGRGSRLAFSGAIERPSVVKLRFATSSGGAVAGMSVTVTTPTGSESLTTDGNGEALLYTLTGTCTISSGTHDLNVSQITVTGDATIDITATEKPVKYAYVRIDQSQSGDTAMITVSATENGTAQTLNTSTGIHANEALQALRESSHLYMGTFANDTMTLRQLRDDDGTKYLDGTTAAFDGTQGDHWMRIGAPFFIKRVSGTDSGNQVTYGIAVGAQPDSSWKQIVSPNDLLAVHEAYISGTSLYSRSGVQSGASQTRDTFKTYARSRGTGFTCVTWEWHCVMQLLFYAWYGRTNCQAQCGTGADSYTRTLGAKNSLGMTDTTNANGNTDDVKFWGLENWWGDKYEWIDNADVNDYVWTITDTKTGSTRTAGTAGSTSSQFITKMLLSENLDFIPTGVGGSETTYYCDKYYCNSGSRVVARSCGNASTNGGVACVYANNVSSITYAYFGSRLAFSGAIEIS